MLVSEFIKWLETQDQGATVEVLVGTPARNYGCDSYRFDDFDPEKHSEYTDMRGNQFAKGKPYENDRNLQLGERA